MANSLLILTEAGEKIGFGHISRCSAIHQFFKNKNIGVDLLLDWHGNSPCLYDFQLLDWRNEIDNLFPYAPNFSTVLVDSYKTTLPELQSIQRHFEKVIVIDDFKRLDFKVNLVINPNIYGDSVSYNCKSAGGKEYVILRESFRNTAEKLSINDKISSVLVTVGGSDYKELLPRFAQTFKDPAYHFNFLCANNKYAAELSGKFKQDNFNFHGALSEIEMKNIMLQNDLAISACGQSLHELAYLGVPTLGIVVGADQKMNCESYYNNGFLIERTESDSSDFLTTLRTGLENANKKIRLSSSASGKKLIDGKGVERIFILISA